MPENNILKCSACGKKLGEGVINDGKLSLKCKCGTITTIEKSLPRQEAEKKYIQNRPYQDRLNLQKKTL